MINYSDYTISIKKMVMHRYKKYLQDVNYYNDTYSLSYKNRRIVDFIMPDGKYHVFVYGYNCYGEYKYCADAILTKKYQLLENMGG